MRKQLIVSSVFGKHVFSRSTRCAANQFLRLSADQYKYDTRTGLACPLLETANENYLLGSAPLGQLHGFVAAFPLSRDKVSPR
jgi:hypothetical protein